jgi:hypothetical protein
MPRLDHSWASRTVVPTIPAYGLCCNPFCCKLNLDVSDETVPPSVLEILSHASYTNGALDSPRRPPGAQRHPRSLAGWILHSLGDSLVCTAGPDAPQVRIHFIPSPSSAVGAGPFRANQFHPHPGAREQLHNRPAQKCSASAHGSPRPHADPPVSLDVYSQFRALSSRCALLRERSRCNSRERYRCTAPASRCADARHIYCGSRGF